MKRNRYKNKYEIVRSMWCEHFLNGLEGFTNIPMLNYPSETTETRAYAGSVGLRKIALEAPNYYSPHPKVQEFEKGFRELKAGEKLAIIGKYVVGYTNVEIAEIMRCSEGKVRRDLKTSERSLRNYLGQIKFSENKMKIVEESLDLSTNFS